MKRLMFLFIGIGLFANTIYAQKSEQYFEEAVALKEQGQFAAAIEKINKAIELDPKVAKYFDCRGSCERNVGMYGEAYASYGQAVILSPKESYLYANRANFFMSIGEFDMALADAEKAIEYASQDSLRDNFISLRALAKMMKMDYEGAYLDFQTSYSLDKKNVVTLVNLSTVCGRMGKHDEAMRYLLEALEIAPEDNGIIANIGFQYQKVGDYLKSIEYFDRCIKLNPNEAYAYNNRAYSKLKLGNTVEALKDVNTSIMLDKGNAYAYRNRALINLEMKNIADACLDLNTAESYGFSKQYGNEVKDLMSKHCK